jgi:hypothetical protein
MNDIVPFRTTVRVVLMSTIFVIISVIHFYVSGARITF